MTEKFQPENLKKDRGFVLIAAGIILPAAFLMSATLNLPHVVLICLAGLAISMVIGKSLACSERSIIYGTVAALVLAVVFDLAFPVDKNRFQLIGEVFSTNISAPFLLYIAVMIAFFELNPYSTGVIASFSIFVILLSSDVTLSTQQGESLLFFTVHTKNFTKIFSVTVILEIIFILLALQPRKISRTGKTGKREKRAVILSALVFTVFLGIAGYEFFRAYENEFRKLENIFLRAGMRRYTSSRYVVFPREVNLNRVLSPEIESGRNAIVLRAKSESPPGYLRGRVYTKYRNGRWTNPGASFQKMSFDAYEGVIAVKSFYYKGGETPSGNRISVYPSRRFSSDVLLVPGSGNRFDLVADKLNFSQDGMLIPEDWQKDGGYTVFLPGPSEDSAFPDPMQTGDSNLVQVPDNFSKDLSETLAAVFPGRPENDREAIDRLACYFMTNFKYSTDIRETNTDPVLNFMKNTRSGHCELFASSMILLLRQYGIPARYVTGFVCDEAHPSGRYYVSRLGNAHAWVEAYSRQEGKWVLVEPTPPSGVPRSSAHMGFWESWSDRMKEIFQTALSDVRRGSFAKAVTDIASAGYFALRDFVWNPFRGPGLLLLAGLWIFHLLRERSKKGMPRPGLDANTRALQDEFRSLEKFIVRKRNLPRPPHLTINEWIRSFPLPDGMLAEFAGLSGRYMDIRFRQRQPSPEEISEFKKTSLKFRKEYGKS
ncbi:MAG: transglutaminase-like domain-containing protein [Victivallales bacterium]